MVRQEVLVLDAVGDVARYIDYHQPGNVPKAVLDSIRHGTGILNMRIFHFANRLVMLMDVEDDFSFERKAGLDGSNAQVAQWEALMDAFQRPIPDPTGTQTGKWKVATKCFDVSEHA